MVNYARMETVWRSYGPLEPIGPSKPKPRRPVKATIAGLVVVCLAGAAGLYFRPDLEAAEAPKRAAPPLVRADSGERAPGGDLGEAARLQSQLEMLVLESAEPATPLPVANTAPAPDYLIARSPAPTRAPAPPAAPDFVPVPAARAAAPVQARAAAPARRAAPAAPAVRSVERPFVLASRTPAPVIAPPPSRPVPPTRAVQPAPQPAPLAAAEPARPAGPSYDCARARTAAERMICASPELADLDRNMAAELEAAVAAGHSPRELARDQASWRQRRDIAAPDPRAVADVYRQRIGQLRSMQ